MLALSSVPFEREQMLWCLAKSLLEAGDASVCGIRELMAVSDFVLSAASSWRRILSLYVNMRSVASFVSLQSTCDLFLAANSARRLFLSCRTCCEEALRPLARFIRKLQPLSSNFLSIHIDITGIPCASSISSGTCTPLRTCRVQKFLNTLSLLYLKDVTRVVP
jgi:hypothetical protein